MSPSHQTGTIKKSQTDEHKQNLNDDYVIIGEEDDTPKTGNEETTSEETGSIKTGNLGTGKEPVKRGDSDSSVENLDLVGLKEEIIQLRYYLEKLIDSARLKDEVIEMDAIKKPSKEQGEESSSYPYRQQSYSLRSQPSQSGFEPPEQSSPPPPPPPQQYYPQSPPPQQQSPPPYYQSSSQQPVDPMKYLPEDVEEILDRVYTLQNWLKWLILPIAVLIVLVVVLLIYMLSGTS